MATVAVAHDLLYGREAQLELVNGELVEMTAVGFTTAQIAGNVYRALYSFVTANALGYVSPEGLCFILNPEGATNAARSMRIPCVSFLRKSSIPSHWNPDHPFPGPPDLAVEVILYGADAEDHATKVHDYLSAGSEQVWVLHPRQRKLYQYSSDQPDTVRIYKGGDIIDTDLLFPGMRVAAGAFFILPNLRH